MDLLKELDIDLNKKELICFIGAGGKTTTMFHLARKLKNLKKKVLVTTTTNIYYPNKNDFDEIIINSSLEKLELNTNKNILVIASELNENKLKGIKPELINDIYKRGTFDFILVECDGSKRKPIKAPASYEPVIPKLYTKVVGIIGLDSLGKKINENNVHRSEIFCEVTNSKINEIITNKKIFNLVTSKNGLFKSTSENRYLILNKADDFIRVKNAKLIKEMIINSYFTLEKIIINSFRNKITGIILASGLSKRMGVQKLLLKINNIPIIERVIKAVVNSKVDEIIIIYRDDEIKDIANKYNIKAIYNNNPQMGQSEAIKLGIINSNNCTAFMFFVGDQPFINVDVINKIIETFNNDRNLIIVPKYNNKNGNPVLFSSILREELIKLKGDIGGREVIEKYLSKVKYINFSDEKIGIDIDTPIEYQNFKNNGD